MTTTLDDLRTKLEKALSEASMIGQLPGTGTWSENTLETFLREGMDQLSNHFPRTRSTTIDCVTDQHNYDLPADFLAVLSVEYPDGEDPPEFLIPMSRRDARFWAGDCYYDVETSDQVTVSTLWISADPVNTEDIEVVYTATHDSTIAVDADITVPTHLEPVVIQYAVWRAWSERKSVELQDPDTTIHLIRDMTEACNHAYARFKDLLAQAKQNLQTSGYTRPWPADDYDRIY
jgi:hypothetical protein